MSTVGTVKSSINILALHCVYSTVLACKLCPERVLGRRLLSM